MLCLLEMLNIGIDLGESLQKMPEVCLFSCRMLDSQFDHFILVKITELSMYIWNNLAFHLKINLTCLRNN